MAGRRAPTLRSQWLGQQLRELREAANLTLKETGDYLQRDQSAVSRLESGVYPAKVPEVLAYVNLCGVDSARRREELVKLAQDAWQTGWWDGYVDDIAGSLVDRIWLETRAGQIHIFHSPVLPGLLQTRQYAEAVIRGWAPKANQEQIDRWLQVRMNRQDVLVKDEPAQVAAVLDEAVLRRAVGGPDVMRPQLDRLVELTAWTNIELRVLPFSVGAHASPSGSFELFSMPEPYPKVGYVESPVGEICVEADSVRQLEDAYDWLCQVALDPDASSAWIASAAEDMQ